MDVAGTVYAAPVPGRAAQAAAFARHFGEMCVSMCAGGGALYALAFVAGPALVGYADPREEFPELSLLAIAVLFTLPMAAWMRFRRMDWRPILEMSVASIGLAVVLVVLGAIGAISQATIRELAGVAFCGPACVLMIGAMLLRLDLYTGRSGHHMAHSAHAG